MGNKIKIEDHAYAESFMQEVSVFEATHIVLEQFRAFVVNMLKLKAAYKRRPLWEWISYFLDWTEYTDFMEWKAKVEKEMEKEMEEENG